MSRILTIAISALILAGCESGPDYDKSAVPNATTALRQESIVCEKEAIPAKFSASKFMACRVAAERNFAMAIDMRKMDVFDTYATKMLALAADYDAGQVNLKRMDRRAASIRSDFVNSCDCRLGGPRGYDYSAFASSLTPTTTNLGQ